MSNFLGNEYKYFIGKVENNLDPLKLKRVKVRIIGLHSKDKSLIPTEDLPWSQNITGIIPNPGDLVKGFFLDGTSAQYPVIEGIFPNIPDEIPNDQFGFTDQRTKDELKNSPSKIKIYNPKDDGSGLQFENDTAKKYPYILNEPTTSRLARNEKTDETILGFKKKSQVKSIKNTDWSEPDSPYNASYPFNNVIDSDSGHVFELDDTPNHERVHLAHRTGSFIEFHPDGSKVDKTIKNKFEIIHGSEYQYVMGIKNIVVQGDSNIYVIGKQNINVDGDVNMKIKGDWNSEIDGKINIKSSEVNFDTPKITNSGQILTKGDQIAGGISQINHGHTGVISGEDISGPPIGATGTPTSDSSVANQLVSIYEA